MALYDYCQRQGRPLPAYETEENQAARTFRVRRSSRARSRGGGSRAKVSLYWAPESGEGSVRANAQTTVVLGLDRFGTTNWHKSKKIAEHAAAVGAIALAGLPVTLAPDLLERPLTIALPAQPDAPDAPHARAGQNASVPTSSSAYA